MPENGDFSSIEQAMGKLLLGLWLGWLTANGASAVESGKYAPGEVLVRLSPAAARPAGAHLREMDEVNRRYGLMEEADLFQVPGAGRRFKPAGPFHLGRWRRLSLNSEKDPRLIAADYARLKAVEFAQPNYLRRFANSPDDSLYHRQWNLAAIGWGEEVVEGLEEIVVGVIDSGLDYDHPDIAAQVWTNRMEREGAPGVDDDGNGYVDDFFGWDFSDAPGFAGEGDFLERDNDPRDESGHGTHVAGIIAAAVGNGRGIAGVAPGVRLMPLRAGFNLPEGGYLEDDDLAAAIVYAAENGARVVNMSWGDPHFSPLLRDVIRYAEQAGCVLVAAAGNQGDGEVFYPARFDNTIAVGAVGAQQNILSFSNWGFSVDFAAPGLEILSLAPGGTYVVRSGTSMAAAHVSGLAAMVLAKTPHLTALEVRGALALSARDVGPEGWDPWSGAGIPQANARHNPEVAGVQILSPVSGAVLEDTAVVQLHIAGGNCRGYQVSWGEGNQPETWRTLARGEGNPGPVTWDVADLSQGPYQIRGRVECGGHGLEDRVAVRVQRRSPVVDSVRLVRALDGPEWKYLVEWRTDVPADGQLRLLQPGRDPVEQWVSSQRTLHRAVLPADLLPGIYEVQVRSTAGGAWSDLRDIGDVEVEPGWIEQWNFEGLGVIPDGFLMPQLVDFNQNGKPELVQMARGSRQYSPSDFYELGEGGADLVHSSSRLFIPWNSHDLDADGKWEIMAVDSRRVRLMEAEDEGRFPERVIWDQGDVWGGEVGDLDGDGHFEIYLRSSQANLFKVFESTGDDRFAEIATLANPTAGTNELSKRPIVGDLDGDGLGELLSGDGDGDLFAYEAIGNNAFHHVWREDTTSEEDGRLVGGGADLDGDGRIEFVVARLFRDQFEPERTRWAVTAYQAAGDNDYRPEWRTEVLGGKSRGNGISVADLNGDGQVELVLVLVPDIYVFGTAGEGAYEPVWHMVAGDTHRPALGDVDGDGLADLAFNSGGQVRVYGLQSPLLGPGPPDFRAYALDERRIVLEWQPVRGAAAYRVYRNGSIRVERLETTRFEDTDLEAGQTYGYAVAALDSSPRAIEGRHTRTISLQPRAAPRLIRVDRLSPHQLALVFTSPLAGADLDLLSFRVHPGVGAPSSAMADRGGRRLVLGFAAALPDSGSFILELGELRSPQGTPLAAEDRRVNFDLKPHGGPVRLLGAEVISPVRIVLSFSDPVVLPPDPVSAFVFRDRKIQVHRVRIWEEEKVILELRDSTPLQAAGRSYEILIRGLEDRSGGRIDARVLVRYAASDLSAVKVFPNPFNPDRGVLTFGALTPEAQVYIFDLGGQLVRVLEEEDGDGGVQWDGLNAAGRKLDSGVYFFKAVNAGQAKTGKFALLRD